MCQRHDRASGDLEEGKGSRVLKLLSGRLRSVYGRIVLGNKWRNEPAWRAVVPRGGHLVCNGEGHTRSIRLSAGSIYRAIERASTNLGTSQSAGYARSTMSYRFQRGREIFKLLHYQREVV